MCGKCDMTQQMTFVEHGEGTFGYIRWDTLGPGVFPYFEWKSEALEWVVAALGYAPPVSVRNSVNTIQFRSTKDRQIFEIEYPLNKQTRVIISEYEPIDFTWLIIVLCVLVVIGLMVI